MKTNYTEIIIIIGVIIIGLFTGCQKEEEESFTQFVENQSGYLLEQETRDSIYFSLYEIMCKELDCDTVIFSNPDVGEFEGSWTLSYYHRGNIEGYKFGPEPKVIYPGLIEGPLWYIKYDLKFDISINWSVSAMNYGDVLDRSLTVQVFGSEYSDEQIANNRNVGDIMNYRYNSSQNFDILID